MTVEAFGAQAEGLCRYQGQVVFVPGALPGEEIEALIVKTQKKFAYGKLSKVLKASADRVDPPCPYYPRCGGCDCQHMSYELELSFKRQHVQDLLLRVGGIEIQVPPVLRMEEPWRYRNKTAMPVAMADGRPQAGFYMRRSHRLVPVDRCLIAMPQSDTAAQLVLSWMRDHHITPYDEESHSGILRHIVVRVARNGDVMVVLVANADELPHTDALIQQLRDEIPRLKSLCFCVNKKPGNVILPDDYTVLWGEDRLQDELCGYQFDLSPLSFFQINPFQAEQLYHAALDLADPKDDDLVFDLYCGAGTLSSLFAQRAGKVLGIEIVPQAVKDAEDNAKKNSIENLSFLEGAAEELLPELVKQGEKPDILLLDPPRKGADQKVLEAIGEAAPDEVLYISCDPGTQARDARILCSLGYVVTACQPVDMFPRTADIENILLFERKAP